MKHLVKVTAEFEFVVLVDDDEDEHEVCKLPEALRDMSTSDVLFNTEAYHDGCIDGWDGSSSRTTALASQPMNGPRFCQITMEVSGMTTSRSEATQAASPLDRRVMPHTLLAGDCLDLMATIESGSVDMILCDLPYGTTACKS